MERYWDTYFCNNSRVYNIYPLRTLTGQRILLLKDEISKKKEGKYMLKSKFFILTILMISLLSIFIVQKKDVIFQEGNPYPLAMAISKIIFQDKEIAEVKGTEQTDGIYGYLVKRGEMEPYIKMMEKEGWRFVERNELSNALVFENGSMTRSVTYQYYTRWYTIIYSS